MARPTFVPLSPAEEEWIGAHRAAARQFVADMLPQHGSEPISASLLDQAYAAWLPQAGEDETNINAVINIVSTEFGQLLVDTAGFEWTVATDAWGTGLAVRALPDRADVLIYPTSFVGKRWELRETHFFAPSLAAICAQVKTIAANSMKS